jgi:hypothetical protein
MSQSLPILHLSRLYYFENGTIPDSNKATLTNPPISASIKTNLVNLVGFKSELLVIIGIIRWGNRVALMPKIIADGPIKAAWK